MRVKALNRNCPICGTSTGSVIHNQTFAKVKNSPLPDNYDIIICKNCGFVFADSSATQDDYDIYYSLLSKYEDKNISSGSGYNQNDYDRLLRIADILENHIDKNDSILDMGCANGGQLKVLKGRGFTNLTGVDPSKNCVNNVMKSGIDAFQTQIFDHVFFSWDKKFDLIILSHVLEHIRDLGDAIQIVKSKLTKKGLIYIEVPDASRYNKFYVVPYYYIDYEHINHFSKNSLNYLMQQFGFKSIETNQGEIKLNKQNEYPYFYSLFSLTNTQNVQICYDNSVLESFNSFLIQSKINNNLDIMLQMLVSSQTEVIVWGAGQFALRLLATSSLSKANIIGFVDSDISKRNKKIDKYQVYSPEFIVDKNACLIICSALYSDEILKSAFQLNKDIKYIVLK